MERVKNFIAVHDLIPDVADAPSIIVGFSGGPDSVALVDILQRLGYDDLTLTHCNFHLRGAESDRDELFCRNFAKSRGLEIVVKDFYPLAAIAKGESSSVETLCRNMRYEWWREEFLPADVTNIYDEADCLTVLCLGHHLDDSIETVLMNFMRGTGLKGMTGIPVDNGWVRRPLLCLTRADIMKYIDEHQLSYVTDSTNGTDYGLRNQIRSILIPAMEKICPQARRGMAQTIAHLDDMEFFSDEGIDNVLGDEILEFTRDGHDFRTIHRDTLSDTYRCYSALYLFTCDVADISSALIQNMAVCLDKGGENLVFRTADFYASLGREYFTITGDTTFLTDEYTWSEADPDTSLPDFLHVEVSSSVKVKKCPPDTAIFDFDKVQQPLHFRRWRKGDRIHPLGMEGTKLVSDLFANAHYTPIQKAFTWIVEDASGRILWASGLRQSEDVRVDKKTRRVIIVRDLNDDLPFDE